MIRGFIAGHAVKLMGGVLVLMALLCLALNAGKLRAERSLQKARVELAAASAMIERQNAAVWALEREAEERTEAGRRALDEARRQNRRQSPQIERLTRSAVDPASDGRCAISETLRTTEGL